ncbi:MAG TPA: DUF1206 domain-containing protein, partial [Chloroflexia bacterium]|nr:DUF1206 domain-containing protein [Chloroflexia bacterium]
LWGFVRAFLDPLNRGTDAKGLAQRVGYFVSGLSYGALVIPTLRLAMGTGAGQSNGPADWTAKLLAEPLGKWLVLLLGLVGLVGGLGQMYMAVTKSFQKDFKSWEMSGDEMKWATRVAQFGLVARGLVFAMLGFFVIQAALQANPKEAKGLDGALATLAHQPHGPWVLGLVALGLVAFGVYSMMCARWIRIRAGQGAQPSARRSTHR